ncbi:MAG TPA: glycosyltransferase [Longimicrobiales bacterium]
MTAAICTRARPDQLARALESLCAQRVPASEILVIDNAPPDDAAERAVARVCPAARYVVEPVPGLDFARNRALAEASGDIVAFLDDDAVASPGWVGAIRAAFESAPALGVCTGRVEALAVRTAGQRLFEANGGYGRGDRRIRLPADARRRLHGFPAPLVAWAVSVGNGASLAVRRDYARQLGGFDEALDLGDVLPGGGDLDIIWRMLRAGHELVYEPDALAWHEHRESISSAVEQIAGHQRALLAFLTKSTRQASGRTRAELLAFLCWRLLKPGVRLAARGIGRDPLPARALLRVWAECWAGLAAYGRARRIALRRRLEHGGHRPAAAPIASLGLPPAARAIAHRAAAPQP